MKGREQSIPDITNPDYFLQLARTVDKISNDLPKAEELRRGADITPDIHTMVGDLGVILTEVCEELATSSRYETQKLTHYTEYERFGTASLAQCAIPIGTALAHLSHVVDRLGFLHASIRHSPPSGPHRPTTSGLSSRRTSISSAPTWAWPSSNCAARQPRSAG